MRCTARWDEGRRRREQPRPALGRVKCPARRPREAEAGEMGEETETAAGALAVSSRHQGKRRRQSSSGTPRCGEGHNIQEPDLIYIARLGEVACRCRVIPSRREEGLWGRRRNLWTCSSRAVPGRWSPRGRGMAHAIWPELLCPLRGTYLPTVPVRGTAQYLADLTLGPLPATRIRAAQAGPRGPPPGSS